MTATIQTKVALLEDYEAESQLMTMLDIGIEEGKKLPKLIILTDGTLIKRFIRRDEYTNFYVRIFDEEFIELRVVKFKNIEEEKNEESNYFNSSYRRRQIYSKNMD